MSSDHIVGIDLGTTNSLVAFMQGEIPVIIPGEDGSNLVPSVVALDENDRIIVGNAARKYLIETPERSVYSIKRLMGRGVEDIQDELKLFPFRLARPFLARLCISENQSARQEQPRQHRNDPSPFHASALQSIGWPMSMRSPAAHASSIPIVIFIVVLIGPFP